MTRTALTLIGVFATLSTAAFAVDGVTLINQATVQAAGGFPYVINQPGTYRLSGNLAVSNATAIQITANAVTLDLNGFAIVCSQCTAGPGIWSTGLATTIMNGTVSEFLGNVAKPYGIYFSQNGASVDHVKVYGSRYGIVADGSLSVTDSVITGNFNGIACNGAAIVSRTLVTNNAYVGIYMTTGTVTGSVFDGNGTATNLSYLAAAAVYAQYATITGNTFTNNGTAPSGGYAIFAVTIGPNAVGYGQNTFAGNAKVANAGALTNGNNFCATSTFC